MTRQTGAVVATIDVGPGAVKLQAADGRMWVRTADRYVAIDPATNTVVATLDKAAVGPAANRSFALDGALWICDGRRLHRYDPTTLQPVATIDLDAECEEVYATDDLVVAYRTNEDAAQSGAAAATFVDPASNQVLATVALPVDVAYPAVLDDAVFFPGQDGATAVVVDRATWTVTATPDLGRSTRVGLTATDGARIYAARSPATATWSSSTPTPTTSSTPSRRSATPPPSSSTDRSGPPTAGTASFSATISDDW